MLRKYVVVLAAVFFAVVGCKQNEAATEPNEQQQQNETTEQDMEEPAMGMQIAWLGHASFKLTKDDTTIYIDPWKLEGAQKDADYVLVSHSHHDHYSPEDIEKVADPNTKLIASADVIAKERRGEPLMPGITIKFDDLTIRGVPAYNPEKEFHPRANNWLGFVLEIDSKRIYYAGDTDSIPEMKELEDIDVALMPVGGKYTMDATQAAAAVNALEPKQAIPYHWGDIVGSRSDAEEFKTEAECEVVILSPGESLTLE